MENKTKNIFSDELVNEFFSKINSSNMAKDFQRLLDGDPVNVDPLKEIPEPQIRLYGYEFMLKSEYFDTEEELLEYIKGLNSTTFGGICIIEYLGNVAGSKDVFRKIYQDGGERLYTAVDRDGYAIYNKERSIYKGKYVWEYNYGDLKDEYTAFKKRGILLEEDVYGKIEEQQEKLFKLMRENNLFNMGKK